jgi:type I restriction enzyme R subunit
MPKFTESTLEDAVLQYLTEVGWSIAHGPDITPGEPNAERNEYSQVILPDRVRGALALLNPHLPPEALESAFRTVRNLPYVHPTTAANNRAFHHLLTEGIDVEYRAEGGRIVGDKAWLVDFDHIGNNDFLAVNQFTVIENKRNRRPDVVCFVNGLPLVVIELKNPADEKATTRSAFNQIQTYKDEIGTLFTYNEVVVISDGVESKASSFLAPWERFMPWRTKTGEELSRIHGLNIETLVTGMLHPERLLDLVHRFIVFEEDNGIVHKKLAAYHQYYTVNVAVEETLKAISPDGDRRIGVVWHTQGSGKSLTMAFFAGKIIAQPEMRNPTLVVITDRNDLDSQLFETFVAAQDLLCQTPRQANDRQHLKELLKVAAGGVVFTTAQKFFPESVGAGYEQLSDRKNIVVIADEAHRSQYGFISGFARHMRDALPYASFIGFTGTPIELSDRNTRHVFGDYISVYDIERSIKDKMTVPIYYEARLAKIGLVEAERPRIDQDFEDITEKEESHIQEKLKSKWAKLEAAVGTEKRLELVADDMLNHFDARQMAIEGKAMIVAMSRRIAVDLYSEIIALRPGWHSKDDQKGAIKVVMSGSAADSPEWQPHIRTKAQRKEIEKRFKDPDDALKVVIVRDMWQTGFDVPVLHTMYLDKPMKGHALMQAIARVNRVFRDKPGGLVVDYLGVAEALRDALATYTHSDGKGDLTIDQSEAVAVMLEKYEIMSTLFEGFDWSDYFSESAGKRQLVIPNGMEHILSLEDGKARLIQHVTELSKAFALAVPQPETFKIRDDLAFYQAVKSGLVKTTVHQDDETKTDEDIDHAVRQIVAGAVAPEGVIDIFETVGIPKPDLSILSEEFLQGIKNMPQKNLAIEVLRKLLMDEIKTRARTNLVQSRKFSEMLERTIIRYQNRTIEAVQVVMELIALANDIKTADKRGEHLGLTTDELAFYDALAENESAREVMGDEQLSIIAREVLTIMRNNVTIDWTVKESVRANLRRLVKRVLRKYGYPPDKREEATRTVLEQAELLALDWS